MARAPFPRHTISIIALLVGAITFAWKAISVMMRLPSTLPPRRVEEAAIFPSASHQIGRNHAIHDEAVSSTNHQKRKNILEHHASASAHKRKRYHPRVIHSYRTGTNKNSKEGREIYIHRDILRIRKNIDNDNNYPMPQDSYDEECIPMSSWQSDSYPNCNIVHELDLLSNEFSYIASGGLNDVFRVRGIYASSESKSDLVLKLLSPTQKHRSGIPASTKYSKENFDIVRKDALIQERLTNKSEVLPIYGHCGFALLNPFGDGGTLAKKLSKEFTRGNRAWKNITSATRLQFAMNAANGLADVHDIGVVHADLTIRQYLIWEETLQLDDFNLGIFLRRNLTAPNTTCTFQMTNNYGTTRAPEEYMHKPQTIAVDTWSLGSVLYHLLTGHKVWEYTKKNKAQEAVIQGILPEISDAILNSTDPVDKVLKKALDMCYVYEPSKRATAREVASFLQTSWVNYNKV